MKTTVLCSLFLFSCGTASKNEVSVKTPFSDAGQYNIKVQRSKKDPSNPLLEANFITETPVVFDVTEKTDESLIGTWTYGKTVILGEQEKELRPEEQKVLNLYERLKFKLSITGNEKIHVENYSEVRKELEDLFLTIYGGDSVAEESEMYHKVKNLFEQKAGSPALLLENFFPEVTLLFGTIGMNYRVVSAKVLDTIQSPYGGGDLEVISEVEIEQDEDSFYIEKKDSISQEKIDQQMKSYLKSIYGDQSELAFDQMPKSKYSAKESVVLSEEEILQSIASQKQFSAGSNLLVNVLEVIVEKE